jgi:hypothetical protein
MNWNWNIGFEWIVTGAAVIGVIVLLITGDDAGSSVDAQAGLQASGSVR